MAAAKSSMRVVRSPAPDGRMKMRNPRALLVFLMLAGLFSQRLFGLEIYLTRPVVEERQARTFGDICVTPQSSDPGVLKALDSPVPQLDSRPALIPARTIRGLLARLLPESFVLVGNRFIYLPKSVTDPGERAFDVKLLQYLDAAVHDPSVRVDVSIYPGQDFSGLTEGSALEFRLPAGADSARALTQNEFIQYRLSGEFGYQTLPVRIGAYGPVTFARRSIGAGDAVTRDDVSTREVDLATLGGAPVQVNQGNLAATSAIPSGSPILHGMVQSLSTVRMGQPITVTLRRGAVAVSLPGRAYGSGGPGEKIAVGVGDSSVRFEGRIVSPTEVIVEDN